MNNNSLINNIISECNKQYNVRRFFSGSTEYKLKMVILFEMLLSDLSIKSKELDVNIIDVYMELIDEYKERAFNND